MIEVTVNKKKYEPEASGTVLELCRKIGVNIPTLCYMPKTGSLSRCMLCIVEIVGYSSLVPSCSAQLEDKMIIETDNLRIRNARRTALELLLSEHSGDCEAPCSISCPVGYDIPLLIRSLIDDKPVKIDELKCLSDSRCRRQCEDSCRLGHSERPIPIYKLLNYLYSHGKKGDQSYEIKTINSKFCSKIENITIDEINIMRDKASSQRTDIPEDNEMVREAVRCLFCDCNKKRSCRLRVMADKYGADQKRFHGKRLEYKKLAFKKYFIEPSKCIKCGICIELCRQNEIQYGLTFVNKGFATDILVPFEEYENRHLLAIISELVTSCPTGAISFNDE